jgi:hypothetical protein
LVDVFPALQGFLQSDHEWKPSPFMSVMLNIPKSDIAFSKYPDYPATLTWKGAPVKNAIRGTFLVAALATTVVSGHPQSSEKRTATPPQKASSASFGSVSGRIFLITKGGDLKPARLARLYLMYERGSSSISAVLAAGEGDTPGIFYLNKLLEATNEANESGASRMCVSDLVNADKAILVTLDWVQAHKLMAYVAAPDVDEEGKFSIPQIRPGIYDLLARGQAGINDAYWQQQLSVTAGEKTEVKVSSVEAACAAEP